MKGVYLELYDFWLYKRVPDNYFIDISEKLNTYTILWPEELG